MAITHPNFKSIHDKIQTADDIYDAVGLILLHQGRFQKRYPPLEEREWTEDDLDDFKIDLEMVDRVYHVKCQKIDDSVEYELACRMDYRGRSLYLHVQVFTRYTWDGLVGEGEIYLTRDPHVFLKSTINLDCNPQGIWQSMVEDGLPVEEPTEFDLKQAVDWRSVPMLKFLCHMAVYEKKEELQNYLELLPRPLGNSVKEFLKVRCARDHRAEDFVRYPEYFGVYLSSSLAPL
ncbi:uncharacterized protein LOC135197002 [Macrobrachium nipponense]|uniref:uncharacterized protein LOC135197002 n=1 Tax=Macrobrachium nipponense TaxID=159736 RepID=UPI0030C8B7A6